MLTFRFEHSAYFSPLHKQWAGIGPDPAFLAKGIALALYLGTDRITAETSPQFCGLRSVEFSNSVRRCTLGREAEDLPGAASSSLFMLSAGGGARKVPKGEIGES